MAKPSITNLAPTEGLTDGGTEVDISGENFKDPDHPLKWVEFGGTRGQIKTILSNYSATVVSPKTKNPGTVNVVVNNGQSSDSNNANRFTYNAPPSPPSLFARSGRAKKSKALNIPTVVSVTPAIGPNAGGTQVVITGTDFNTATAVNFGTSVTTAFTINSTTMITVPSPGHAAGTVDVQVTNPGGQSQVSPPVDLFTYVDAPTVSGLQPNGGPRTGNTLVLITGTNFNNVTNVTFGGTPAIFTVTSSTMISATSPPFPGPGPVLVRVTNPSGTSNGATFTYA